MPITPGPLRTEIHSGPLAATLLPLLQARSFVQLATVLNDRAQGGANVDEVTVTARQILGCLAGSEYLALTAAQRQLFDLIITEAAQNGAPIQSAAFRNLILTAIPASASTTRSNLAALQSRQGSRIEILFGAGERIDESLLASWYTVLI